MCFGGRCVLLCIGDIIMMWCKNIYFEVYLFVWSYFGFVYDKYKEKWNYFFFEECMIIFSDRYKLKYIKVKYGWVYIWIWIFFGF